MKPKTNQSPESVVREIKRKTRRKFNPEERIRIILEGLKGEDGGGPQKLDKVLSYMSDF